MASILRLLTTWLSHHWYPVVAAVGSLSLMTGVGVLAFSHPTPPPSPLAGVGEVCLFYAPTGAPLAHTGYYFGHVGWGFRIGQQNEWTFGATEGTGAALILPHQYNGAWMIKKQDWNTMLATFANRLPIPRKPKEAYHEQGYYTQFRCRVTIASNFTSAESLASDMPNRGYDILNSNCLIDAYQILSAYADENIFPLPQSVSLSTLSLAIGQIPLVSAIPKQWFPGLAAYGFSGPTPLPLPQKQCATPLCSYTPVSPYPNITFPSSAIVKIVPARPVLHMTYTITATTQYNPRESIAKREVSATVLHGTTAPVSETVKATGHGQTQGTQAWGTLIIANSDPVNPIGFSAGTEFTNDNANAIVMVLETPVVIPPATGTQPGMDSVDAYVLEYGTIGNIPSQTATGSGFDYCNNCGTTGYEVYNTTPFTGGTDPQPYMYVQQSDIDNAANALIAVNKPNVQQVLQSQVPAGQRVLGKPLCSPNTGANQAAGNQVAQVTVVVTFTCSEEVYDYDGALIMAKNLLKQLGNALYAPDELISISTSMQKVVPSPLNNGVILLTVQASGMWQAQLDAHMQLVLATTFVGLSKAEVIAILDNQPDIQSASIHLIGGSVEVFPSDPAQISVIIQNTE